MKIVSLPKEMLGSFSIVQFLNNHDVTKRKQRIEQIELILSCVPKGTFWGKKIQSRLLEVGGGVITVLSFRLSGPAQFKAQGLRRPHFCEGLWYDAL